MNIYLDENRTSPKLASLLLKAGHQVHHPKAAGLLGASDPKQFSHAIVHQLVVLTNDRSDFHALHELIPVSGGRHPGILLVAKEKDSAKNMKLHQIVAAIAKAEQAGLAFQNQIIILNHWR